MATYTKTLNFYLITMTNEEIAKRMAHKLFTKHQVSREAAYIIEHRVARELTLKDQEKREGMWIEEEKVTKGKSFLSLSSWGLGEKLYESNHL